MTGRAEPDLAAAIAAAPVTRLAHFTPAINLCHIIENGELRSITDMAADARACYRVTDRERLDGHPDKVCCSLEYPNGFYFDIARNKAEIKNYPDWVCLLLDKDVAALEGTLFCQRNAAAGDRRAVPGLNGFRACYAPQVAGRNGTVFRRGSAHNPACPTDVQAEVLVAAPVPLSAVRAIVLPTDAAATEEFGRLDRINLLPPPTIRWVVSAGMFDKQNIADTVRFSRPLAEATWEPESAA